MNERIRELAKQAGFYISYDDKIYTPTISEEITDCQTRFAELIVRECITVLDKKDPDFNDYSKRVVKEHFGVE